MRRKEQKLPPFPPPPPRPPGRPPVAQRWEHIYVAYYAAPQHINQMLAAYSAEGWELVSHVEYRNADYGRMSFTFKRPL